MTVDLTKKLPKEFEDDFDLDKEITQFESISDEAPKQINQMGYLWEVITKKLNKDSICFKCKEKLTPEGTKNKMIVIPVSKTEQGLVAFVSVCEKCGTLEKNE